MTCIVCNDSLIITFCTLLRSFGVLLWEIASYGQHPHGKIEPNDLIAAFEQEKAFLPKYVCVCNTVCHFIVNVCIPRFIHNIVLARILRHLQV